MTATSSRSLADFWAKRGARIYPAYLFCGIITTIFYAFFTLPDLEVSFFTSIQNFLALNILASADHIDGAYWSLVVEIKFYLFFGLFFYYARTPQRLVLSWLVFCVLGWVWDVYDLKLHKLFLFPHSLMFLVGMTLYFRNDVHKILLAIVFVTVVSAFFFCERYADFSFVFVGVLMLATFAILRPNLFLWQPVTFIGIVSYSWYLVHQNVGAIIIRQINETGFYSVSIPAAVVTTFLIGVFSFYCIEGPGKSIARQLFYKFLCWLRLDRLLFHK